MPDEQEERKRCFVVGAIGEEGSPERIHADWLLEGIIRPVFREHFPTYKVDRADKIARPGMIDSQIINLLLDAELVIADMSWLNANAFYEMGIRHMAQEPIIHMFRATDPIPFDVKPHRAIPFSTARPQDLEEAKSGLRAAVAEVHSPGFQVENPVTRARGVVKLQEHATPKDRILFDELTQLKTRLSALEGRDISHSEMKARIFIDVSPVADQAVLEENIIKSVTGTTAMAFGAVARRVYNPEPNTFAIDMEAPSPSSINYFAARLRDVAGVKEVRVHLSL